MFCLDGEIVFIYSKQVNKTGLSTLILSPQGTNFKSTSGVLQRVLIPSFPPSDTKNQSARTEKSFSSLPEVSTKVVASQLHLQGLGVFPTRLPRLVCKIHQQLWAMDELVIHSCNGLDLQSSSQTGGDVGSEAEAWRMQLAVM